MSLFRLKKILEGKLLEEAKVPGVSVTKDTQDESGKENKSYYKEVTNKMKEYDNASTSKGKPNITPPEFNYNSEKEKDYHDEVEIMNGMEMNRYDRPPNERFKDRAIEAIEGSSRMGNNPEWANVVTADQAGFTGPDFGKELVKRIKSSKRKQDATTIPKTWFGDDIEIVDQPSDTTVKTVKKVAVEGENPKKIIKEGAISQKQIEAINNLITKYGSYRKAAMRMVDIFVSKMAGVGASDLGDSPTLMNGLDEIVDALKEGDYQFALDMAKDTASDMLHDEGFPMDEGQVNRIAVEGIHESTKKRNTMKRLNFKVPFEGTKDAMSRIPEAKKENGLVFEMTDGKETYRVRWEGTITEGEAVILRATDKTLIEEDINKMKHLMGYKSEDTLGKITGKARLVEDSTFMSMLDKTKTVLVEEDNKGERKVLLETEDIDGQTAKVKLPNDPTLNEEDVNEVEDNADHNPPIADAGIVESEEIEGQTAEIKKPNDQMGVTPHAKAEKPIMNEEDESEEEEEVEVKIEVEEEVDRLDEVFAGFDDDDDEEITTESVEEKEVITESEKVDPSKRRFDDILRRMNQIS